MNSQSIIVSVVIQRNNQLLLVQEGDEYKRGKWSIPTGHVEIGENLIVAAEREVKEEAGVTVAITGLLGIENYTTRDGTHKLKLVFTGSTEDNTLVVDGKEILAAHWFTIDELRDMRDQLNKPQSIEAMLSWLASARTYPLDMIRDYL